MVLFDDELRLLETNDAAVEFLQLPREELLKRTIYDFTPEEDRWKLPPIFAELLEKGHVEDSWEALLPDGSRVSIGFSAVANISPGRHLSLVHSGWERLEPAGPDSIGEEERARGLTPREAEVLQALAMGVTGPQVGERLSISYATVRAHTRNAMAKLGARTQAHVIALALKRGLISPP